MRQTENQGLREACQLSPLENSLSSPTIPDAPFTQGSNTHSPPCSASPASSFFLSQDEESPSCPRTMADHQGPLEQGLDHPFVAAVPS